MYAAYINHPICRIYWGQMSPIYLFFQSHPEGPRDMTKRISKQIISIGAFQSIHINNLYVVNGSCCILDFALGTEQEDKLSLG